MFFEDLSPYRYHRFSWRSLFWRELNVGWLDSAYPFVEGKVPDDFLERLFEFNLRRPIRLMRGIHKCQFCCPRTEISTKIYRNGRVIGLGSGEIRVRGCGRIYYAAPTMIYHYVETHRYLPPQEFIEAVLKSGSKKK